jgi:hypothetical protein
MVRFGEVARWWQSSSPAVHYVVLLVVIHPGHRGDLFLAAIDLI